jgi:hypothetical protein
MVSSADTKRGRTEAYERMRVGEDRIRVLRGQSVLLKQSLKSSKKLARKDSVSESPYRRSDVLSPAKEQAQITHTLVDPGGYQVPVAIQYSLLDSKQYT